mmetsp:Transcript_14732/g.48135  ORF Transcript_14732/g.48135 Transcript_14732/m.48135 type:complete len:220 (+) Transcript_14732:663-1322(+)
MSWQCLALVGLEALVLALEDVEHGGEDHEQGHVAVGHDVAPLALPVVERAEDHRDAVRAERAEDAEVDEPRALVEVVVEGRADHAEAEDEVGRDEHHLELERRVTLLIVMVGAPRVAGLAVEVVAVAVDEDVEGEVGEADDADRVAVPGATGEAVERPARIGVVLRDRSRWSSDDSIGAVARAGRGSSRSVEAVERRSRRGSRGRRRSGRFLAIGPHTR